MLRETVNAQIVTGKRNFAIELSLLDYVYSDTINVLMGLNKRILDVSGRLALLSPQPEALQVLKRAGIHNILRIFDSEADLLKTSEDIILQTTSYKVSDLQALANEKLQPESEFDQLRSEIGSVFGGPDNHERHPAAPVEPPYKPAVQAQQPPMRVPSPPPVQGTISDSVSDEFDNAFNNLESYSQADQGYSQGAVQSTQQYAPQAPAPGSRTPSFKPVTPPPTAPVPPQFQGRQYVPPSPAPQTRFDNVPKMPSRGFVPPEPPKAMPDFSAARTETQRYQPVQGSVVKPSVKPSDPMPVDAHHSGSDLDKVASSPKRSQKAKAVDLEDSFESDDDFQGSSKKKSPLPIIIAVLLVLIIGGAIALFTIPQLNSKPKAPVATNQKATVAPVAKTAEPQVPVDTPKVAVETPPSAAPAGNSEAVEPPVEKEMLGEKAKPLTKLKSKTVQRAVQREEAPAPIPTPPSVPANNRVVISSVPTGASVEINGEVLGTTPYTWNKPIFGLVNVTLRKSGYSELIESFEFTGGNTRQSYTLQKAAPPPPAPVSQPVVKQAPVETPPAPVTPPPSLEPEPVIPPPVSTPSASGSSGDASIFIASIPPVADVYLNGKMIGKTNVSELKLPSGTHTLKFVKGSKEVTKDITVQSGKNPSQMVRLP